MILCHCSAIADKQILKSFEQGNDSLEKIQKSLRCCINCKGCSVSIEKLLEKCIKNKNGSREQKEKIEE